MTRSEWENEKLGRFRSETEEDEERGKGISWIS